MRFPIKQIEGHKIIDSNGNLSFVYEYQGEDFESKEEHEVANFIDLIAKEIRNIKEDAFLKFYFLEGRKFYNTDDADLKIDCLHPREGSDFFKYFFESKKLDYTPFQLDDLFKHNGEYYRYFHLNSFNESSLLEIQKLDVDYFINIKKINAEKSIRKLKSNRRLHYSNTLSSIKNIESESAYQESEELLEEIVLGKQVLYDVEIGIILKEFDLQFLRDKTLALKDHLKTKGIGFEIETNALAVMFRSSFFGVRPFFRKSFPVLSHFLVNLLPLNGEALMEGGVKLYSLNHRDLYLDLFHEKNSSYCMFISGPSGSGKSFLGNYLVQHELNDNSKVVIIDKGGTFKKLNAYYKGHYLGLKFNPMQFRSPRYLKELIVSMYPEEHMDKMIEGQIYAEISQWDNLQEGSFKDLLDYLSQKLGKKISYYFAEVEDFFDNENRELFSPLYVDLDDYPDSIRPLLILYIMEYFNQFLDDVEGRRVLIIDECWDLLGKHAQFVDRCFRTFRKRKASVIALTQSLTDLEKTGFGDSIYKNSFHKILFYQESEDRKRLSEFDLSKVRSLSINKGVYSEFYYKSQNHRKILRYYPTPLEFELFSSEEHENIPIRKYFKERITYLPYEQVMNQWVELKYGH